MDPILIRYGESVTLPIDTGDSTAVSADLYIGKPGETYTIHTETNLTDGEGVFLLSSTQTQVPLDTYFYQINVTDANGYIQKYPTPEDDCSDCETEFPKFVVLESLDLAEVS